MHHDNTPTVSVIDPRGLDIRSVAYHRRDSVTVPESNITQHLYDASGRAVLSRDPRLFLLHQQDQDAANQVNISNLAGSVLLSENGDAGWRLGLPGEDGKRVESWDQKLTHFRELHDAQGRPTALFEGAHGEAPRCIVRFTYGQTNADQAHNRCGQMIRHDDTAGCLHYLEFSLGGAALEQSRTFSKDPFWPVDWPQTQSERDQWLEDETAVTRIHCNAAGEPVRQTDAKDNVQTFRQTCAAELKEVRLRLAGQQAETPLVSQIQYNASGQIERQLAGNGVVSSATYRPEDGRLVQLKAEVTGQPPLQDLTYEHDAAGNILRLTDRAAAVLFHRNQRLEPVNRYRYDSLYRLIEATGRQLRSAPGGPMLPAFQLHTDPGQLENYTQLYTYDKAGNLEVLHHLAASGNRTERTAIARLNNRSLPQKLHGELPDQNEIAAGFDVNGNRKMLQPGQRLHWDLRNQLSQVEQVVRQENEPDDIEHYLYDGSGQRLRKIRLAYTATLSRTHETRYLPGVEIRTDANQTLQVIRVKAGRGTVQVLHWEKNPSNDLQNQHRYSFTDHLNSSTLELDAQARLISQESYYPYGGTCWWAGRSQVEASFKTLRYAGNERDATGLYYYGFRYYAPWFQRWLSADPQGTLDGLNLFAMVHGNPIGHTDLHGLVTVEQGTGAALATFARDGISALASGTIRYLAAEGLQQWASEGADSPPDPGLNLGVTVAGTLVGALAGGSIGMGAGSRIASSRNYGRTVQKMMAGIFGLAGAAAGATAPLYAYLADRKALNLTAIAILASTTGNMTRETAQRAMANVGPSVTVAPSAVTTALRVVAYGGLLSAGGAARAGLAPGVGVLIGAAVEGLDGVSITTINSLRGGQYNLAEQQSLTRPKLAEWLYGVITRTAGSTLTSTLGLFTSPLTGTLENGRLQSAVVSSLATPTEARTYFGQHVQLGAFELIRADDADFTLDRFTPPNSIWRNEAPHSYHPETPNTVDLPMRYFASGAR